MDEIFADHLSDIENYTDKKCMTEDSVDSNDMDIEFSINHPFVPLQYNNSSDSESNSEDEDEDLDDWSEIDNEPNLEEFLGHSQINATLNDSENIREIIDLFCGEDLFDHMSDQSNRYYVQNENQIKESKKGLKWKPIDVIELKKMLGLTLLMGIVRKDSIREYWSLDPTIETPFFSKIMSRERFRQIWRSWHFFNNEYLTENSERLMKIYPILNYFVPKFNMMYSPEQELSLFETVIPWRGRTFFKTYNKSSKDVKNGLLIRMVCEASTGYICNLEIFSTNRSEQLQTIESVLSPYFDLWHHVYLNNYQANKIETAKILLNHNIRMCGTIEETKLPKCLKMLSSSSSSSSSSIPKNGSIFRRNNDILLQIWRFQRRNITMISTIHSAQMIDTRCAEKVKKPISVVQYNKFIKKSNLADYYISQYSIWKNAKKWSKRVVLYLINCALFNAFCLWKKLNKNKMQYKKFLQEVARLWIFDENGEDLFCESEESEEAEAGPSGLMQPLKRTSKFDPPHRLSMDMKSHQLIKIASVGKKRQTRRRCRVCTIHKKRSETCYMCKFCQIPLHKGNCFNRYHTIDKY